MEFGGIILGLTLAIFTISLLGKLGHLRFRHLRLQAYYAKSDLESILALKKSLSVPDDFVKHYYEARTHWKLIFAFASGIFNFILLLTFGVGKMVFRGKFFGLSRTQEGFTGLYVFGQRIDQPILSSQENA